MGSLGGFGVRTPALWRALAAALVLLALVAARVHLECARELAAADEAAAASDLRETLVHLRRAARWNAPFDPGSTDALERLRMIGERAEGEGDTATALYAFRAIRAGTVASESLFSPHAAEGAAAEQRIAALMARVDPPQLHAEDTEAERGARYLAALREHGRPNRLTLAAVWLGFALFLLGLAGVAVKGFDSEDRPNRGVLGRAVGLSALGFALLTAGLALA
ncbi:MAG: hypothetical protein R3B40_11770 [Polyangiales bacterium]|nr:hypothetical protein [Myxococcales bacterium]MCB9657262.1 hypothetical protein [Sandaracinaceae bacterium]